MSSVNKVFLVGRVGKDPETKNVGGNYLITFPVATSEKWKDKQGQWQEKTEWHSVNAWANLAKVCKEYVFKGQSVFVEGSVHTRSWEDNQGVKRYSTSIKASNIQFLTYKDKGQGQATKQQDFSSLPNLAPGQDFPKADTLPAFDANEEVPDFV